MARQQGLLKLTGTIGDISFYKTQDGYLARAKGGVDAHRIANDPRFQRTRENAAEFGRAGKAGKLLRTAFRMMLVPTTDNRMVSRLTQRMVKVIQADPTSARGMRNVTDGAAELLTGFEFNIHSKLGTLFHVPFSKTIHRTTGAISVALPAFVPADMIEASSGTTHFKIVSAGAAIDFAAETFVAATSESAILPWDGTETAAMSLTNMVSPASIHPLFLVFGVAFYQEINGQMYLLHNGAFNPLAIAGVDQPNSASPTGTDSVALQNTGSTFDNGVPFQTSNTTGTDAVKIKNINSSICSASVAIVTVDPRVYHESGLTYGGALPFPSINGPPSSWKWFVDQDCGDPYRMTSLVEMDCVSGLRRSLQDDKFGGNGLWIRIAEILTG